MDLTNLPTECWATDDLPTAVTGANETRERYAKGVGLMRLTFVAKRQKRRGFPAFWSLASAELLEPAPDGEARDLPTVIGHRKPAV